MHITMYKIVTNTNLLCSTENSMQYFVMAQVRKESKRRSSLFEWEIEADAWSWLSESSIKLCVTGTHSVPGRTSGNTQISLSVSLVSCSCYSLVKPSLNSESRRAHWCPVCGSAASQGSELRRAVFGSEVWMLSITFTGGEWFFC